MARQAFHITEQFHLWVCDLFSFDCHISMILRHFFFFYILTSLISDASYNLWQLTATLSNWLLCHCL